MDDVEQVGLGVEAVHSHEAMSEKRRRERVLYDDARQPVTEKILRCWLSMAQRARGPLRRDRSASHPAPHLLLAPGHARGVPAKAIQELAGHEDLATTLRYMHLSPAARESAIALLNEPATDRVFGEIVETEA